MKISTEEAINLVFESVEAFDRVDESIVLHSAKSALVVNRKTSERGEPIHDQTGSITQVSVIESSS